MSTVCLQAEIDWIKNNVNRYESVHHARLVVRNIAKRYEATAGKQMLAAYKESKSHEDLNALFEFVNNGCKLLDVTWEQVQ